MQHTTSGASQSPMGAGQLEKPKRHLGVCVRLWLQRCGAPPVGEGDLRPGDPGALLPGKQALRHWLHRLYQRRGLPPHLHLEPGGAGRQGAAALRRGGLRGRGLRQRGAGGHPQGRVHLLYPGHHPAGAPGGEQPLCGGAGRRPLRLAAQGQAGPPVRFFRLRLHPHHGHLADGVAGVRAPKLHPVRQVL